MDQFTATCMHMIDHSTDLFKMPCCQIPIVVRRVPAKKMDCPKVQLGSAIVTFFVADTPLLVATTILAMNFSNLSSITKQMEKTWSIGRSIHFYNSSWIFNICSKNLSPYSKQSVLRKEVPWCIINELFMCWKAFNLRMGENIMRTGELKHRWGVKWLILTPTTNLKLVSIKCRQKQKKLKNSKL